ncbi:MAG: hypothetical protein R2822_07955 [Spirosomataceae bacterium]
MSGIALNHVDDWNPDFILTKQELIIPTDYHVTQIRNKELEVFSKMVGESRPKFVDSPTKDQLKLYYKDASLHLNFSTRKGLYEHIAKRPIFMKLMRFTATVCRDGDGFLIFSGLCLSSLP